GGGLFAAGDVELASARRAGTDKDRIVVVGQELLHALDAHAPLERDVEVQDVVRLFVDHRIRQAEFRDLRPHHAAGLGIGIEHRALVTERGEIARDGERGRPAADQRDAFAVLRSRLWQAMPDVVLEVGGDALEAADRDRIVLDPDAAAGRLAGAVAGAPQDPGEHVGLPIDHVGIAIAAFGDQADVFRDGGMCRAGPLAIDYLVEVVGGRNISRSHSYLLMSAQARRTARPFLIENAEPAFLVVSELDHRLTLLEPFNLMHKAKFA